MSVVMDASAVLAAIKNEPGSEQVLAQLRGALLSVVNWAEVRQKLNDVEISAALVRDTLLGSGVEMVDFDLRLAELTADLRPHTKALGLSLGDRACLALAIERNMPALTGDKIWAQLDLPVDVNVFR